MNWKPSPWFLAEVNHVLAGALVMLAGASRGWPLLAVLAGLAVVAALKEFWADRTWLESDSWAGSAADFCTYLAGGLGGALAGLHFWTGTAFVAGAVLALTLCDIFDSASEPQ